MQVDEKYPLALPQGTILAGQYVIGRVLGQGGFGITYQAADHRTGRTVAVKEFFPDSMAARTDKTTVSAFSGERGESFAYGKDCFLKEAETLAQFIGNEHIVRVFSYFEENGTAYFVMEFIEGTSFDQYIKDNGGKVSYEDAEKILLPVIDALADVHAKGIVHRDVTPDNIYITKDGGVKLLDFGAARYSLGDQSRSLDVVLKHGFAPKEQYTRHGRQGPYTDVYTVGASFYFAVTGRRPPDSIDRLEEDDLIPPSSLVRIPREKENAILTALSVQPAKRYQTMGEFRQALMGASAAGAQPMQQRVFAVPNAGAQPMQGGEPQSGMPQPMQQGMFTSSQMPYQPSPQPAMQNMQWTPQQPAMQNMQWTPPQPVPMQQKQNGSKKKKWLLPAGIGAGVAAAAIIIAFAVPHGDKDKKEPAQYVREDNSAVTWNQPRDSTGELHMAEGADGREHDNGTPVLYYDLPAGFTGQGGGMYYAPDFPNDSANIYILESQEDEATFQYTKESFCRQIENLYKQIYGYEVDVNCTEFTKSQLNGCNTLTVRISYTLLDMEFEQVVFSVEIEENIVTTITYSQLAGGGWMDAFNASIDSMRIEYVR